MTLVLFIVLLTLVISVHEFGHLIAAKFFNVYCKEFSIGMGPLLFQKKYHETLYSVRAIPLGGYLAMAGENPEVDDGDLNLEKERTFNGIAPLKRIVIQSAGIIMNFALAILLIGSVLLAQGVYPAAPEPIISDLVASGPAEKAGFQINDEIVHIEFEDGVSMNPKTMNDLTNFMALYEEGDITFTVLRGEEKLDLTITPEYEKEGDRYVIGIYSNPYSLKEVNIFNCWYYAIDYSFEMVRTLFSAFGQLARGSVSNMSGVVGIYEATGEIVAMGFLPYILLIGVISLNLGFMNALPIPMLDGGRIIMSIYEIIFKKPIPKRLEAALLMGSMFLLLLLMLVVTYNDILKIM